MKMEWGWAGEWPIFVYMTYIKHGQWKVKVVKGVKGDQNAGDTSSRAKAWFEYVCESCVSRFNVYEDAEKRALEKLGTELWGGEEV